MLGAKAGFVAMWVILVSCLVKVAVQLEFGKRAIMTGETTFASFNSLPGPKIGKANWTVWTWLVLMLIKFLQVGAIVGLVSVLLNMAFPGVSDFWWLIIVVIAISSIVVSGYYKILEVYRFKSLIIDVAYLSPKSQEPMCGPFSWHPSVNMRFLFGNIS